MGDKSENDCFSQVDWIMTSVSLCRPKKGMEDRLFCDAHKINGLESKESENTMDLFDLIARTQNSRIDDQRCELPGSIHVSELPSHC